MMGSKTFMTMIATVTVTQNKMIGKRKRKADDDDAEDAIINNNNGINYNNEMDIDAREWEMLIDFNFCFSGLSVPSDGFFTLLNICDNNQVC